MSLRRHAPIWLLAVLPPLFWAGNFVLARALHEQMPPLSLSFWRWAGALAILLPFTWRGLRRQWPLLRGRWPALTLLAVLGITNYNSFAYLGLQETTATNAVLLSSIAPLLIIALSWLLLRRPVLLGQVAGVLLSLVGVLVIATAGRLQTVMALQLNRGDLWVLAASLDWALYSVCLRWRPSGVDPLVFLTALIAVGLVPLAGLYGWELAQGARFALSGPNLGAIGYVALFPSVLAYVYWNRSVAEMGPDRTGQYLHLMPVFGALLGVVLLGETLHGYHAVGVALIACGIILASLATRRQPNRA